MLTTTTVSDETQLVLESRTSATARTSREQPRHRLVCRALHAWAPDDVDEAKTEHGDAEGGDELLGGAGPAPLERAEHHALEERAR